MDFRQAEAVVGSAIADLLAMHACKGNLDFLPAAEVIRNIDRPAFCIIGCRTGIAVVEHIHEHRGGAVIAIQPERDALISTPVLSHPGVNGSILKVMHEASVRDNI